MRRWPLDRKPVWPQEDKRLARTVKPKEAFEKIIVEPPALNLNILQNQQEFGGGITPASTRLMV
jgi:hypothetical protein